MKYLDQLPAVDVRKWKREGHLNSGNMFSSSYYLNGILEHILLVKIFERYLTIDGQWIELIKTANTLGGERVWFSCPACQRKCAKLFLLSRFTCRICSNRMYTSQAENSIQRSLRRSRKIRKKLGAPRSILEPISKKPPYMHWKTYVRLVSQANSAEKTHFGFIEKLWGSKQP